jgi:hypothetical protein
MHEVEFQNWLNHARSVGYTDTEIRTLLLKAGWSYQQVNDLMHVRGLTPGSAYPNPRGHVVKPVPVNPRIILGVTLTIGLILVALAAVLFVILQ